MSPERTSVHGVATGGVTRTGASTPLIAPPSVRRIPSSRRCVSAMLDSLTASANRAFGVTVTSQPEDLLYFRGDNAYVWQFQDNNTPEKYVLTYLYLQTIDTLGLLDALSEDGDYGVFIVSDR